LNAEIEDIARMLPMGDPELTPTRHRELKAHFAGEIGRRRRARPRLRLAALLAPVATAGVAAALLVPSLARHGSTPQDVSYVPAPVIRIPAATTKGVARTLNRIADAAARRPTVAIGPHQYTYTRSMVESTRQDQQRTFDGTVELIALHERQTWLPEDTSGTGLSRENGQDMSLHLAIDALNYRRLAALPTDPAALLDRLYARQGDRNPARAFDQIQELMDEASVPPATRAALYRATALIPGVRVVSDSVDALGRKGFAVAFDANGERGEWIFDRTSLAYLGQRDYLLEDSGRGKAGTLMSADAVQSQTVVDHKGQVR
jgi:hypothetical protein